MILPMPGKPLYQTVNGEPVVSTEAMALLIDLPVDVLRAEIDRQHAADPTGGFRMPREWAKRGHRVRKEVSAALGFAPGMKDAIDYLAARKAKEN